MTSAPGRFDRQERFAPLGARGQARIERASALIVGCGALGGSLAQTLARCGVGRLVIADRDVVDPTNLARQVLFEERDVGRPKAFAAAEALARVGGPTRVEPHALHVDVDVLEELARDCQLILDGTDNLSTRYLINDYAVERGIAWIYGGVVGSTGLVLPVIPGRGPCLRCVFPEPAPPGALPTCDTSGVILPAVAAVAAFQAGAALRVIAGGSDAAPAFAPPLIEIDVWSLAVREVALARASDCPCCVARRFEFADAPAERSATVLCGRNTVQVAPVRAAGSARPDLAQLAATLRASGSPVALHEGLLRFGAEGMTLTVFPDGRALIEGTDDPSRARAVYDRWIGS